jgi:alkylation response protein AidB-like acyl-CoA dehydrogenase
MANGNPLLDDALVDLLLYDVLGVERLCERPRFADHDRSTFDLYLGAARRLARDVLFPSYKPVDEEPAVLKDGRVFVHDQVKRAWPRLAELGLIAATRDVEVGGQQLPESVALMAFAYLAAGNGSTSGYAMLTGGAGHLVEVFADDALKAAYLPKLYAGEWTGTMALTEPQAGSGLADLTTRATPAEDGSYRLKGAKIFISAGDHDAAPNVVHMVLARTPGAPPGLKGVSLFLVPNRRPVSTHETDGELTDNDVVVSGLIHKIGWKGIPSLALEFGGDRDDCHGWLVGTEGRGLAHMFQMMNEARLGIGANAVATASVAYQEALAYAQQRRQGRKPTERDPTTPTVPIIEHADVRRMLLRQKAIVSGGLALVAHCAFLSDLAHTSTDDDEQRRHKLLLDLLTPIAKTFPAEAGFESNTLALQIHGGYGYSSEYLPEAWLRDQKLNAIHEGTTGIQGLDLLGRKVVAEGGAALMLLRETMQTDLDAAPAALAALATDIGAAADKAGAVTAELGQRAMSGDVDGMLRHSHSYMQLMSTVVIAWQLLRVASAAVAKAARTGADTDATFADGAVRAARYWGAHDLAGVGALCRLLASGEDSFASMPTGAF